MLIHLTIQNYALIRQLTLEPSPGLSVITGETGAGKSIMLGAIGLLMGNRADTKVLWSENEKCITEGVFDIRSYNLKRFFKNQDLDYADQTVLRREISPGGKSRAFINDTPVTLDVMKKIGSLLMDIHSQHETLLLGNKDFQLSLIDTYAGNQKIKNEYAEQWETFVKARKELKELTAKADSLREEADYVNFQLNELVTARLEENEQEALESELKVIDHAEEIKGKLQQVMELVERSEFSSRSSLAEAKIHLQSIGSFSPLYETLYKRLESIFIELDDIVSELEKAEANVEFDPERAEFIKERLSNIYRLQKKHRVNSIKGLLQIQEELLQKSSVTSNIDQSLAKAKLRFEQAASSLDALADKLGSTRKKIFTALSKELVALLKELGIPEAQVSIDHAKVAPDVNGSDETDILFSANKGIAPKPLAQVASGGEFSRLMFCIKYIMAEKTSMPTLILDEIDSGVSGEIAIKLGNLMKAMASKHQLIAITHLPQIAAKGNSHYFVYKDNSADKTISNIRLLKDDDRIKEIAQMIGGARPSKVALEGAKEMLSS